MNTQLVDAALGRAVPNYPRIQALSLKKQRLFLKLWLVCTDAMALVLAFQIATWIRFDVKFAVSPEFVPSSGYYPNLVLLTIPLWILIYLYLGLYGLQTKLGGIAEYARIFNGCTIGCMLLVIYEFLAHQLTVSRGWLLFSWLLTFFLVSLGRFITRRLVYTLRRQGYLLTPAAIIGINKEAVTLASHLCEWHNSGYRILGFIRSRDKEESHETNLSVLGNIKEIQKLIDIHKIEDLIVAETAIDHDDLIELAERVNEIPQINIRLSSGLYEIFTTGVTVRTVGTVPLITVNKLRLERMEAITKCVMDYILTLALLFMIWPILIAIALLVKLDSPGPVFYKLKVLGTGGRSFYAYKFRTMLTNGDDLLKDKPMLIKKLQADYKLKNDPRITEAGRWLRKYSLDELPQFFNVLLRQMSLVGPRFITAAEAEIKYGHQRFNLQTVKPGMTGLWQVSGRSDISYEDRIRLDMYYIRNYSIWLDLQILFVQTLPAVIKSHGAY